MPQDDIIHTNLTVQQALKYAARLRLPPDMSDDQLSRIVLETMESLELDARSDVPIYLLSGGQRKRVSVGVEMLSRPGVLFLDEPTSGLDPGTESRLMKMFRRLADQGRTVVCTTHVMENIDLFDKIVVLAPGGKLAWFGPPRAVGKFFGVDRFCDLYEFMEQKSPDEWKERFAATPQFAESIQPVASKAEGETQRLRKRRSSNAKISWWRQWRTLTERFLRLQWADRTTLAVNLAQPLLITLLVCVVCSDIHIINFLLVISALWFGCSSAAQQVVRERSVYQRERMVNLRLDTYLCSKFLPLMLLTGVQTSIMLIVAWLCEDSFRCAGALFVAYLLSAWNGVAIGLVISCASSNSDKAMSVVPLTLIPQIILAGVLVPIPHMDTSVLWASMLTTSRWATQACESSLMYDQEISAELLTAENIRPLQNLFPDAVLDTATGQQQFVADESGGSIDRTSMFRESLVALIVFPMALWGVACWILRRQDKL